MSDLLSALKTQAGALAARQQLRFYEEFASELAFSRNTFFDHPLVQRCREDVIPFIHDQYGHGTLHSKTVAIEASAIVLGQSRFWKVEDSRELALLAQLAGLLHDICRMEEEHAKKGAELAGIILQDYPISDRDKDMVAFAIRNHEAFRQPEPASDHRLLLLSDALYDADKFRWGPDNFVTTLWEICDYLDWPMQKIIAKFPQGMEMVETVAATFRTELGKQYGPEFIELGLTIGHTIYRRMLTYCRHADCNEKTLSSSGESPRLPGLPESSPDWGTRRS